LRQFGTARFYVAAQSYAGSFGQLQGTGKNFSGTVRCKLVSPLATVEAGTLRNCVGTIRTHHSGHQVRL